MSIFWQTFDKERCFLTFIYLFFLNPFLSTTTWTPERKLVESSRKVSSRPKPLSLLRSLEEKYVAVMKKLQFGELVCFLCGFVLWHSCLLLQHHRSVIFLDVSALLCEVLVSGCRVRRVSPRPRLPCLVDHSSLSHVTVNYADGFGSKWMSEAIASDWFVNRVVSVSAAEKQWPQSHNFLKSFESPFLAETKWH